MPDKKIKYIELKVISFDKKLNHKPKVGVFSGYKKVGDVPFIRISEDADSTLYFSTHCHAVQKIKIVYEGSLEWKVYTLAEKDKAIEEIRNLTLELRGYGIVDKNGAIDINKYCDLPERYLPTKTISPGKIFGQHKAADKTPLSLVKSKESKKTKTDVIYKKPGKEVTHIRRRTKKPSKEFLAALKKKVKLISNGVYKAKLLPKIIEVKEIEEHTDYNADYLRRQQELEEYYGDDNYDASGYPNYGINRSFD